MRCERSFGQGECTKRCTQERLIEVNQSEPVLKKSLFDNEIDSKLKSDESTHPICNQPVAGSIPIAS